MQCQPAFSEELLKNLIFFWMIFDVIYFLLFFLKMVKYPFGWQKVRGFDLQWKMLWKYFSEYFSQPPLRLTIAEIYFSNICPHGLCPIWHCCFNSCDTLFETAQKMLFGFFFLQLNAASYENQSPKADDKKRCSFTLNHPFDCQSQKCCFEAFILSFVTVWIFHLRVV